MVDPTSPAVDDIDATCLEAVKERVFALPIYDLQRGPCVTNLQRAVGRNQLLLFWFALVGSVLLHFAIGGVVVDQKFDENGYFLMLRDQPSIWIETNMIIYYLKIGQPWVLGAIGVIILASFMGRYFKEIK